MSINNATPQDWDRLRKQAPAIETTIDESMMQVYVDMSKEELEAYIFDDDEDVVNSPNHYNTGSKHDEHKARMSLIPPKALLEVGMVLTEGAEKYGDRNWKKLDNLQERYTSAALRHMMAHMAGETYDEETNLSHLAHAICCLMFKLEVEIEEGDE